LDLPVFDALYLSGRRNDAREKLEAAWARAVTTHGDKDAIKNLQKEYTKVIGSQATSKGINEFIREHGKGF
jgi:hypothetical protein